MSTRREFNAAALALPFAGLTGYFSGRTYAQAPVLTTSNWAGNVRYSGRVVEPSTPQEASDAVRAARSVGGLGYGHAFVPIADRTGTLISMRKMKRIDPVNRGRGTVRVQTGLRHGEIGLAIHKEGFALDQMISIGHVGTGGFYTASHGSGLNIGCLATQVAGLTMVTADGELVTFSEEKDGDRFFGTVVNLGALGLVTELELKVEPAYNVAQMVYEDIEIAAVIENFDAIMRSGSSVSVFTDWNRSLFTQIWVKQKLKKGQRPDFPESLFGAKRAPVKRHPVRTLDARPCTHQLGEVVPWYDGLPHFLLSEPPSSAGKERHFELFVPLADAQAALRAVAGHADAIRPVIQITELRVVAADKHWMSPFNRGPQLCIHFTLIPDDAAVNRFTPIIEEALRPFKPTRHWSKMSTLAPSLVQPQYRRIDDFRRLARDLDPRGAFTNGYIHEQIMMAAV